MGYRFNSGMGGYTCDYCEILIYAGSDDSPLYCYETKEKDVATHEDRVYCSKKCREADEEWEND